MGKLSVFEAASGRGGGADSAPERAACDTVSTAVLRTQAGERVRFDAHVRMDASTSYQETVSALAGRPFPARQRPRRPRCSVAP